MKHTIIQGYFQSEVYKLCHTLQHTQLTYNIHNILMISTFPKQRLPLELELVFLKTTKPNWRM